MDYSRYKLLVSDGKFYKVPFIEVPTNPTDAYAIYEVGKSRLDLISYQYYNDPNYGWLILQANPSVGSLEFNIQDKTRLRVPYPLENALQGYEENIKKYDKLYGLK